ncbi:CRISPR system precrRNA processing endoribonuclease RAMP protein Cas6 [Thermofilum pendens]|uniref:CRISPR-associated protein Cas6 C-terminal domain-containing protein n=1 Tax=Thermofilum pendens (strain DSM 2475 / Hrk 5) TaxID=368408 RepID=A1RZS7_THEPD|nr:CRISPR system precrRNA processing endoribonuclease RAMP protein Cas6 [Thermofilum pendens]ABL78707.1 hypothetical protein Tpen_1310 [Thermofilum pendens Hrk 5]
MGSVVVVELSLRAVSGGSLPWFSGAECRGALLSAVGAVDGGVAGLMHGKPGSPSVFALRPLRFASGFRVVGEGVSAGVLFERGALARMEVAFLDEGVARRAVAAIASTRSFSVKGQEFALEGLALRVYDPARVLEAGPFEALDVRFHTPTYFNPLSGDKEYKVLYPDPVHMLAGLVATAHRLTGASLPKPEELASTVYVAGLDVKTPPMEPSKPAPNGFVGWVKLKARKNAPSDKLSLVHGLLKLGELTNIGGNRSAGYGVITVKTANQPSKTTPEKA